MVVILAVNFAMGATSVANTPANAANAIAPINQDDSIVISPEQAEDKEQLKELAPATPEEAERSIYPIRRRFLMWTHDGVHIMWGVHGNGRFVGTDNLGKRCWGIYGKGVMAGFYDGEFFWGKYDNGSWTQVEGTDGVFHMYQLINFDNKLVLSGNQYRGDNWV